MKQSTLLITCLCFVLASFQLAAQEYPSYSGGAESGIGEFTNSCNMPNFTYSIDNARAGNDTNVPGDPQIVENAAAFDALFGPATGQQNIEVEVPPYLGNSGDPISITTTTTINFNAPTPPGELGFIIADVEQDQVTICALDASGAVVSNAVIDTWFQSAFDANSSNADGSSAPSWDGANATLVGEFSSAPVKQTVYVNPLPDNEAGAASFVVNISISQLIFKSQALGISMDDPSQHFILASTCVEPTCAELAATPELCSYITSFPASSIAAADCDNGGISNLIECQVGDNPSDPIDDCAAAEAANIDICQLINGNANHPLANADCDGGGVINLIECNNGGDPFDAVDDCSTPNCFGIQIIQN